MLLLFICLYVSFVYISIYLINFVCVCVWGGGGVLGLLILCFFFSVFRLFIYQLIFFLGGGVRVIHLI